MARPPPATRPRHQQRCHQHLRDGVGADHAVVHGERVSVQRELKREQRLRDTGDEAVDRLALLRRDDAPPLHGAVAQPKRHVQRHHRLRHLVHLPHAYHLNQLFVLLFKLTIKKNRLCSRLGTISIYIGQRSLMVSLKGRYKSLIIKRKLMQCGI